MNRGRRVVQFVFAAIATATLLSLVGRGAFSANDRADILIADFERPDFGDWKVTGTAFGTKPANGTLPNQMPVTGFLGQGLVNSYVGGDGATGTLTSPMFKIERRYINFLVGGGRYADETCVNLMVDGRNVRTSTGPNERPGGTERLDWSSWDVQEFAGQSAAIVIVDQRTGGWGHINVDQIVQSDRKREEAPASKTFVVEKRFLLLPVRTGEPMRRARLSLDGQTLREFDIELAESAAQFHASVDLHGYLGQQMTIAIDRLPADSRIMEAIAQSDRAPVELPRGGEGKDADGNRPAFHFTSRVGWLNDPNGLVYDSGTWHLFFQLNPYGWNWGNMHWGHAVSKDLIHWEHQPIALYPRQHGDWCFSGSAVVDAKNSSGFQTGNDPPLVAAFTSTGRGECIIYSNDHGRTWTEFSGNPVIKHSGRDPRILWHEPSRRWVIAVYDEFEAKQWIAFYTSPDLKEWQFRSRIGDFFECPDVFEIPVEGTRERRWVLYGADGKYVVGRFDGERFHIDSGKHQLWYGNFYAAQTFSNAPNNRRVQIGWANGITFPGQAFNQQMTVPCDLTMRTTDEGPRLFAWPVPELHALRGKPIQVDNKSITPGEPFRVETTSEMLDAELDLQWSVANAIKIQIRGVTLEYDIEKQTLKCGDKVAEAKHVNGRLPLRILTDKRSLEVFANAGRTAMSVMAVPSDRDPGFAVSSSEGTVQLQRLSLYPLSR